MYIYHRHLQRLQQKKSPYPRLEENVILAKIMAYGENKPFMKGYYEDYRENPFAGFDVNGGI